jgi:hypothetical protein
VKQIGRYIFSGLTVLSLVLCVATVGLWVRSYYVSDEIRWLRIVPAKGNEYRIGETENRMYRVSSGCGGIGIGAMWERIGILRARDERPLSVEHDSSPIYPRGEKGFGSVRTWHGFGFEFNPAMKLMEPAFVWGFWSLIVPLWALAVLFFVPPAISMKRWLRRRGRGASSRCVVCNYDLRATPDRCPECGAIAGKGVHV